MIAIADNSVLSAPNPMPVATIRESIEALRAHEQVEMPLTHAFSKGKYIRSIFMPAGTIVVGHVHRHRHWNFVLTGKAMVSMNGAACKVVKAGDSFESEPGVQKWLYIEEDCHWTTTHENPTDSQDVAWLEENIVEMDEKFLAEKGSRTLDDFRMLNTRKELNPCPSH